MSILLGLAMELIFRCHPALEAHLPRPMPAREALPAWLKEMQSEAMSAVLGQSVRTVKHCPPFIDAMGFGALIPLAVDLTFEAGTFSWESDLPVVPNSTVGRSPIGVHVPEQAAGSPLDPTGDFIIKFMNFWTVEVPKGCSVLFCHPINRADLPFRTLTGMVDCDAFSHGLVHFPAIWSDKDFEGTLAKGTPVAQCVPVRREAIDVICESLDEKGLCAQDDVRDILERETGVYRKAYRAKR